jgi:hypothetical protein
MMALRADARPGYCRAAGIACKYVHAALSSATVSTLHKTVDSGAALAELTRAWSAWHLWSTRIPEPEPEAPVWLSEPEEKASEQPKLRRKTS